MVRRIRSAFELEVFDQTANGLRRLEDLLAVCLTHLTPKHRTETSQPLHDMREPLEGRRMIYSGLTFRDEACGYCALMYYPSSKIGVFDFMVIAPTAPDQGGIFRVR